MAWWISNVTKYVVEYWHKKTERCEWVWSTYCVATAYFNITAVRVYESFWRKNCAVAGTIAAAHLLQNIVWCIWKYINTYEIILFENGQTIDVYFPFDGRIIFAPSWHSGFIWILRFFCISLENEIYIDFTVVNT